MSGNPDYWAWIYVRGKLDGAVETLATSFAPNSKRMEYALFQLLHLQPVHFPDQDIYGRIRTLLDAATEFGHLEMNGKVYEGSLSHTLRRRKRVTFERYAKEILDLADEVARRGGPYSDE